MPDEEPRGLDSEALLQREVERVLADPLFQRSPVQSRLLDYLCAQTLAHNRNISQHAVAIDGLGRPDAAAPPSEAYPRVQVSRLRRNLSRYYTRHRPGEGLAVYIRHGDYQLRLAPPERAYGERPAADPASLAQWRRPALWAAALFAFMALASLWLALR